MATFFDLALGKVNVRKRVILSLIIEESLMLHM